MEQRTDPNDDLSAAVKAASERFALAWLDLAREIAQQVATETPEPVAPTAEKPAPAQVGRLDPDSPWLTAVGAAARSTRSLNTVRRALQCGELHGHQLGFRGHWKVAVAAVDAWVKGGDGKAECGCLAPIRLTKRSR
jgi:hypothetical protein